MKNQQTWARNNRIQSVRVGPCTEVSSGEVVPIEVSERFDTSAVDINRLADDAFDKAEREQRAAPDVALDKRKVHVKDYCIRLMVEAIVEGQASDTCISEFRPVFNCG